MVIFHKKIQIKLNDHNLLYDQNQNNNHNLSKKEVKLFTAQGTKISIEAVIKNNEEQYNL